MAVHEEIGKFSQRISEILTFIDNDDWEGINFQLGKYEWKNSLIII